MIKFIVIDDEPYVTSMFSKLIDWQSMGFEPANTFNSATKALDWLENNSCDVIFTDIYMPQMSGIELTQICNELYPEILIIFFSAHRNFDYALNAIKYSVFDYIIKPITQQVLLEAAIRIKKRLKNDVIPAAFTIKENVIALDNNILDTVKNYMHEHYAENISMPEIAEMVGLSNAYLSTYFKQQTGTTLVSYLKRIRLEKAKELLRNQNIKITHISAMVGFNSYSYFTKTFQSEYGEKPIDYRERIFEQYAKGDQE